MRRRWVYIDGVAYEAGTEPQPEGLIIIGDIEPYQSMIDGSLITSRSRHREHLRQHGCVEIGDQTEKIAKTAYTNIPDVSPEKRRELIRAQMNAMSHDEFTRMHKRELDRIRWNSR